ncbi:MAG: osmoprotectant uptake system permease [Firmicutes bacterium HGW-Firmicutes-16]|nr:MAG: osmoprotectant uptake system permease [Firmicutes bacterium HGW-Firmicutes-16]
MKYELKPWLPVLILIVLLVLFSLFFQDIKFKIYDLLGISDAWETRYSLAKLIGQHIVIVFYSGAISIVIGVILGALSLSERFKEIRILIEKAVYLFQMIPSLALLTILVPIFGMGQKTAVVALVVCGVLPVYMGVVAGVNGVPSDVIEVAEGLGMPKLRIYRQIVLPLAMPVILAGFRTSLIINVSAATLAAKIGAGGLGILLLNALKTGKTMTIIEGTIPICLLAIIFDICLKNIENIFYVERKSSN